jgi:hypothetical protein
MNGDPATALTADQIRHEAEARIAEERGQFVAGISFPSEPMWPEPLAPEAFYGLAGDYVRTIEPHTESDPAAILLQFLVAFGNVIGGSAHFMVEADRHRGNLFVVLVGETSKGRKGTSWGQVRRIFGQVDSAWGVQRVIEGLSSGEGLIWAVRDPIFKQEAIREGKTVTGYQDVQVDPGIADKRLLVVESEFTSVLRTMNREGNTLSATIRKAWDDGVLRVLTKNSPATATRSHISIIAHVTREDLRRDLSRTDAANGFGNRFLWACVRRSKALPEGGNLRDSGLALLAGRISRATEYASRAGRLTWTQEALGAWREVYKELSEGKPGLFGALTSRAEAQVLRLACLYALLDGATAIRPEHLLAALGIWGFCETSARHIFGDATGDPVSDRILEALRSAADGLTRTDIRDLFGRNRAEHEIGRALEMLRSRGRVACQVFKTGGRPLEKWLLARQGVTTKTTETTEGKGE